MVQRCVPRGHAGNAVDKAVDGVRWMGVLQVLAPLKFFGENGLLRAEEDCFLRVDLHRLVADVDLVVVEHQRREPRILPVAGRPAYQYAHVRRDRHEELRRRRRILDVLDVMEEAVPEDEFSPLRVHSDELAARPDAVGIARAPDRVAYTLLDSIVESYTPALDELALEIAELEDQALQQPTKETLNRILQVKKEVMRLRQTIAPQREVLARFARGEFKLIRPHLVPYYKDVYDSLFHISELAQAYTDSLTGILQVYLNMSSNQTGEVVKVLTPSRYL